jgi:hypothetical protein
VNGKVPARITSSTAPGDTWRARCRRTYDRMIEDQKLPFSNTIKSIIALKGTNEQWIWFHSKNTACRPRNLSSSLTAKLQMSFHVFLSQ